MITPLIDDLKHNTTKIGDTVCMAKPIRSTNFIVRLRQAWAVFCLKATAVHFREDELN